MLKFPIIMIVPNLRNIYGISSKFLITFQHNEFEIQIDQLRILLIILDKLKIANHSIIISI